MTHDSRLNAVCPYFTMFPLGFPLGILRRHARPGDWVLDPFCGRGTTTFAARLLGLGSVGIDSSPVAVAIARAKLASTTPEAVMDLADRALAAQRPVRLPEGPFWALAYHPDTLQQICRLRQELLGRPGGAARVVLRAILLGALHGPRTKGRPSHLSNQSPRTFAPKPDYAVRFWKAHGMRPPRVDVRLVIRVRAERYLLGCPVAAAGRIVRGDSRLARAYPPRPRFRFIITSPPYYGLRTYASDQWLRSWFLGGPPRVVYRAPDSEIRHRNPSSFAEQLRRVWRQAAARARPDARLVIRFGGIHDREVAPRELLRESLRDSGWRVSTIRDAGNALGGRRQAEQFGRVKKAPRREIDLYARLS